MKKATMKRVAADAALLHRVDQLDVVAIGERLVVVDKAAHDEIDDADQHAQGGDVGQQPVDVADGAFAQEGEAVDHPFQNVAKVHQEVENEAQGDHDVEGAAQRSRPPDRFGRDPVDRGIPETAPQLAQRGLVALPAHHHAVDVAEAQEAEINGGAQSNHKENFLEDG
jgi:hypothetical protein